VFAAFFGITRHMRHHSDAPSERFNSLWSEEFNEYFSTFPNEIRRNAGSSARVIWDSELQSALPLLASTERTGVCPYSSSLPVKNGGAGPPPGALLSLPERVVGPRPNVGNGLSISERGRALRAR
jgi:hypothetical protein